MNSKQEIPIALSILETNIREICTVSEWANRMGYTDAKYFSRLFRNHFGIRPMEYIKSCKIDLFIRLIQENPSMLNYEIALEMGLRDESALYKYIKRHTGHSPTVLKGKSQKLKNLIVKKDRKNGYGID